MVSMKNQKILIIAPHPDDEIIGCGGFITKMKALGNKVYVLFLTVGDTNDFSDNGFSSKKERIQEIQEVAEYLEFDGHDIAFADNNHHLRLDQEAQIKIISKIERESPISIEKVKPTIIMFPSATNYNQDHRAAAQAAFAACRPSSRQYKYQPEMVFSYEVAADQWNMDKLFSPNFFVKLTNQQLKKKLKALRLYKSQLRQRANPRSPKTLQGLAALRGSQSGNSFAEAFYLYRIVL